MRSRTSNSARLPELNEITLESIAVTRLHAPVIMLLKRLVTLAANRLLFLLTLSAGAKAGMSLFHKLS